jgi:hypothetical protein
MTIKTSRAGTVTITGRRRCWGLFLEGWSGREREQCEQRPGEGNEGRCEQPEVHPADERRVGELSEELSGDPADLLGYPEGAAE